MCNRSINKYNKSNRRNEWLSKTSPTQYTRQCLIYNAWFIEWKKKRKQKKKEKKEHNLFSILYIFIYRYIHNKTLFHLNLNK